VTTTVHTYIRCGNQIYVGDAKENWRELHNFETEKRAKRWQRDQDKKRPGSVIEGHRPLKLMLQDRNLKIRQEWARQREIRKLALEQAQDRDRHSVRSRPDSGLSGKTAQLARAYVAPDRDASSFLRERSKKRVTSRNARNTRATFGAS